MPRINLSIVNPTTKKGSINIMNTAKPDKYKKRLSTIHTSLAYSMLFKY